jgi:DNA-binding NtrC family response regulator
MEDDTTMRQALGEVFRQKEIEVFECDTGASALNLLQKQSIDVMLLDMNLPDTTGLEVWRKTREMGEDILCIFMTAYPEVKTAVSAMRDGAFDYINKPFELDEIRLVVDKAFNVQNLKSEVVRLRYEKDHQKDSLGIIGQSDPIKNVRDQIYQVAQANSTPVLIFGESGTGKELVADAIHNLSNRKDKPMMVVNCSAIPDNLLESELFGYEKGAFTDAKHVKKGIFEMADTGTIFLDEIGDLSVSLQPKLLRVLETGVLRRVGGTKDIQLDVRVVSASNQDLREKIKKGMFRSDLLYRLNVFAIHMPTLRDRVSDIPQLANHFLKIANKTLNKTVDAITNGAMERFKSYTWPGNVRELKNVIERACILTKTNVINEKDCGLDPSISEMEPMGEIPVFTVYNNWLPLHEIELQYIQCLLKHCNHNKSEAARQLGISRVTLREKIRQANNNKLQ